MAQSYPISSTPRWGWKPPITPEIADFIAKQIGFEAFPVGGDDGKQPAPRADGGSPYAWKRNRLGIPAAHRATDYAWEHATGYALTPIVGTTGCIIDTDDPGFLRKLVTILPCLWNTFQDWRSTTGPFYGNLSKPLVSPRYPDPSTTIHFYVNLSKPLPGGASTIKLTRGNGKAKEEIASLRGAGAYAVGPGSLHVETGTRRAMPLLTGAITLSDMDTDLLFGLFEVSTVSEPLHFTHAIHQPPLATPQSKTPAHGNAGKTLNPRLLSEIERQLGFWAGGTLEFSHKGTATPLKNPIRGDDKHHSSFYSRTTGCVHDRATGEVMLTHKLCNLLDIRMNDFGGLYENHPTKIFQPTVSSSQTIQPSAVPTIMVDLAARSFPQGVPLPLCDFLLNQHRISKLTNYTPALLVWALLHKLLASNFLHEEDTPTLAALKMLAGAIGWNTTLHIIKQGVNQLTTLGVMKNSGHLRDIWRGWGGGEIGYNSYVSTFLHNHLNQNKGGAPALSWQLQPLSDAIGGIQAVIDTVLHQYCNRKSIGEPTADWFDDIENADQVVAALHDHDKENCADALRVSQEQAQARYEKLHPIYQERYSIQAIVSASGLLLPDPTQEYRYDNTKAFRDTLRLAAVRANPGRKMSLKEAKKEAGYASTSSLKASNDRIGVKRLEKHRVICQIEADKRIYNQIARISPQALSRSGLSLASLNSNDDVVDFCWIGRHTDSEMKLRGWVREQIDKGYLVVARMQVRSVELEMTDDEKADIVKHRETQQQVSATSHPAHENELQDSESLGTDHNLISDICLPVIAVHRLASAYARHQLKLRGLLIQGNTLVDYSSGEIVAHLIPKARKG